MLNRVADATLIIKNRRGKTVFKQVGRSREGAGKYWWRWTGKDLAGELVKPGPYRATINTTIDGTAIAKSTTVRVATKTVSRKTTLRKNGLRGKVSTRGNCGVDWDFDADTALLNCAGGAYAATTYTFKVPAKARISWTADLGSSGIDECCQGTITKRGKRIGKYKYEVRVQVTGRRATIVNSVDLIYKIRVKI